MRICRGRRTNLTLRLIDFQIHFYPFELVQGIQANGNGLRLGIPPTFGSEAHAKEFVGEGFFDGLENGEVGIVVIFQGPDDEFQGGA